MIELQHVSALPGAAVEARARRRTGERAHHLRMVGLAVVWAIVLANAAVMVWLWVDGGNLSVTSAGEALTSVARITGLLAAYLALIQVILLARLRPLERLVGFDRLTVWHRWNGFATIWLVVAHVVFSVWGYALMDRLSIGGELSTMVGGGIYPGMITATVGTGLLLAVVASSVVIVRRRLRYEWWYAVHLAAYAGIALAWFHQIPTGNELVLNVTAADYWRALYVATLVLLVTFRLVVPAVQALRYRLRVASVVEEAPGVVSLSITGRGSSGCAPAPASSSSGGSSRTAGGRPRIRSRSRPRRTVGRCGSPSRRSVTTPPEQRTSGSARASSRRARSGSSPTRPAGATGHCS